jgi:putative oxidoreductase
LEDIMTNHVATSHLHHAGSHDETSERDLSRYLVPVGRSLFAVIFVMASFGHFSARSIGYAASQGVPFASLLVPLSGIIALAGGLSIAFGYRAKLGAWLIVLFLVPVTFAMHRFWAVSDPMAAMMQQIMFMKNVAMLGAALILTHLGGGPCSLDNRGARQ